MKQFKVYKHIENTWIVMCKSELFEDESSVWTGYFNSVEKAQKFCDWLNNDRKTKWKEAQKELLEKIRIEYLTKVNGELRYKELIKSLSLENIKK